MSPAIVFELSDADVERIAEAVARRLRRPLDELLTLEQAAAEANTSTRTLRRKIELGLLASEKLGYGGSARVLIRRAALQACLTRTAPVKMPHHPITGSHPLNDPARVKRGRLVWRRRVLRKAGHDEATIAAMLKAEGLL